MNSLGDILADGHLQEIGFFRESAHPTEGAIRTMKYPTEFSKTPTSSRTHAPLLGENTVELLLDAGYNEAMISHLIHEGAAIIPSSTSRDIAANPPSG